MGLLDGKKALIIGVANDHSIGWGIARALHAAGAELGLTYRQEGRERRVAPLAERLGAKLLVRFDVRDDAQIAALMAQACDVFGKLDIIVHTLAGARREDLSGPYLGVTRESFLSALDTSAYSLTALVQAALGLLNPGASIITLTYHGARQVAQNYNVMGVTKAALEASVRALAADLGPRDIRVNAISAGPIRTLSASGIAGFRERQRQLVGRAPLGRGATIEDVGNTAVWLCSAAGGAVTGETIYVDAGLHHMAES
ncbi:MAG: enoyl-ACP reductase [Roseiflexaceae bacterium]